MRGVPVSVLVLITVGFASAQAQARTVAVRGGAGSLLTTYQRLHVAGLLVRVPQTLSFDLAAPPRVRRLTPRAGTHVASGSVVTVRVSCCAPATAHRSVARTLKVPDFLKLAVSAAAAWAHRHGTGLLVHLGPLAAGGAGSLLGNYRATRQRPAAGTILKLAAKGRGARVPAPVAVWGTAAPRAKPGPPCSLQRGDTLIARDAEAVIFKRPYSSAENYSRFAYWGCAKVSGVSHLLTPAIPYGESGQLMGVALRGEFAAIAIQGQYHDDAGACHNDIWVFYLPTGAAVKPAAYVANYSTCAMISSLTVNASGFAAWKSTDSYRPVALSAASCASVSLCVAVGSGGGALTSSNPSGGAGSWQLEDIDGSVPLTGVSCPAIDLCVAVDRDGNVLTSSQPTAGGAWTLTHVAPAGASLTAVSCSSPAMCAATDSSGEVLTSTDPGGGASAWSSTHLGNQPLDAISCPAATLCVVSDAAGNVLTSTSPTRSASWTRTHLAVSALSSVSCPSTTLCLALTSNDPSGHQVFWSNNPSGGTSAWSSYGGSNLTGAQFISCATNDFCLMSGAGFRASRQPTAGANTWSATSVDGNVPFPALVCPTATLCIAGSEYGYLYTSTNPTGDSTAWTRAADANPPCNHTYCETEDVVGYDHHGTRVLDTASPTTGTTITALDLTDDTLTWQNAGIARSATLN